ncbi:hypothetical protein BS47DRAFT_1367344 [Hydnum rufescens UP504]|uniref:Uncharacterized protein n=1 Tax=Hydnum rufescens UP504 TaxID=1448309 RepID=A0A9P6AIL9_9AGAM|nr:hypothetical protein BS47DRAFT_1367344 [Hydnum rufescens UP504]
MARPKPHPDPMALPAVSAAQPTARSKRSINPTAKGSATSAPKSIPWAKNPEWTDLIINALKNNEKLRHDLFGSTLKKKKITGLKISGVPKSDHHLALAEVIFKDDKVFGSEWIANPTRLATSVSGRMDALKRDYKKYQSELNGTGGGVTTEQREDDPDVANQIGKCLLCSLFSVFTNTLLSVAINKEFPWYDDLHAMWRDNPAYNPLAVTNVETKSSAEHVEELSAILHRKTHQGSPAHEEDEKDEDNENEDDETGGDRTSVGMGISDEYEDILDTLPMSLSHTTPPLPAPKPPTLINKKRKSSGPLLELPPTPKHSKPKARVDAATTVKLAEIAAKAKDRQADQELKECRDLRKLEVE